MLYIDIGPTWGRHLQHYLLRDEEFCMQTDSHMDYVQDWDVLMMKEWAAVS
jgi:Glycosyltransferase (GlcNAc)